MVFGKTVTVLLTALVAALAYAQTEINTVHWLHVLIGVLLVFLAGVGINRSVS